MTKSEKNPKPEARMPDARVVFRISGLGLLSPFVIRHSSFTLSALLLMLPVAYGQTGAPEIRTPPPPHTPRINGPDIFGVRPDHPFLYHIPTTGDRPMEFSADKLPAGLTLDSKTGDITGSLKKTGKYTVTLHAKNAQGANERKFRIVAGETIDLTPAMGWNSWNHYAGRITQDIVLQNAKAMVDSGLINHGWTYINIDDTWQGKRTGKDQALQGNEKFPDMQGMCDAIHEMGLKFGIYSTP